jgi:hypothetical protein
MKVSLARRFDCQVTLMREDSRSLLRGLLDIFCKAGVGRVMACAGPRRLTAGINAGFWWCEIFCSVSFSLFVQPQKVQS